MADRIRLLVALALATALSRCSVPVRGVPSPDRSPAPSSAGQLAPSSTYTDPNGRFTIVPPPGFTSEIVNGTTTRFVDPLVENDRSYPGTPPTLEVEVIDFSPMNLPSYVDQIRSLQSSQLTLTIDQPETLRDGTPAHLLGWAFHDARIADIRELLALDLRLDDGTPRAGGGR